MKISNPLFAMTTLLLTLLGCSKSGDSNGGSLGIPLFRPPVAEAVGPQFASSSVTQSAVSPNNFQARFFGPGPTNILNILQNLDDRLSSLRPSTTDASSCLNNTPTAYPITVLNDSFTLQLQCYDTVNNTGLIAFGHKDDTWYVFEKIGAGAIAAKATTLASGKLSVEIYGGVGLSNGTDWSSGSYGGYHLKANNQLDTIEMAVAGIGFGFCGAYLNSDGTNSYIRGSEDGVGQACQASANACVLNANLAGTGNCSSLLEGSFSMTPLGRSATTNYQSQSVNASTYPSVPNVTLNGLTSDAVHFGPSLPSDLPATVTSL